jgi:hypothetical protein
MEPKTDYHVREICNSHDDSPQMLNQLPRLPTTSVHMVNTVVAHLTWNNTHS